MYKITIHIDCPECDREVDIYTDPRKINYMACCPHCGEPIRLCQHCMSDSGICDYDSGTDSCCRLKEGET